MNITCQSRCQSYLSHPLPPEDHGTPAAIRSRKCVGWWKEEIGANGMHSELMGEFQCPPGIAENWSLKGVHRVIKKIYFYLIGETMKLEVHYVYFSYSVPLGMWGLLIQILPSPIAAGN